MSKVIVLSIAASQCVATCQRVCKTVVQKRGKCLPVGKKCFRSQENLFVSLTTEGSHTTTPTTPSGSSAVSSPGAQSSSGAASSPSAMSSSVVESDTVMASATSPSATSDSQLDSRGSTLDRPKFRASSSSGGTAMPGISTNGDTPHVDLSAINNNYVNNEISRSPRQQRTGVASSRDGDRDTRDPGKDRSHRRDRQSSGGKSSGKSGPGDSGGRGATNERATLRKLKQRCRRKSRENDAFPDDVIVTNTDVTPARISYVQDSDLTAIHGTKGPAGDTERHRRLSRTKDGGSGKNSSPKFKQYGFIDDPEVLSNRDAAMTSQDTDADRIVQRQNSNSSLRHSSRNSSRERKSSKEFSQHGDSGRTRDKSKSRESSRERARRRSTSRDRKGEHHVTQNGGNKETNATTSPGGRPLDNAVFVNGDVNATSRGNKHGDRRKHERRGDADVVGSSNMERRRKRRSTGDRTFPESQSHSNKGYRHSHTTPALNGCCYDNSHLTQRPEMDDNDDVFVVGYRDKEVLDNVHQYPRKSHSVAFYGRPSLPYRGNRS